MIILGITGGIGHGKTVLADAFGRIEPRSLHLESSNLIAAVADAMHARMTTYPDPHDLEKVNAWLGVLPEILQQIVHQAIPPEKLIITMDDIAAHPELYEKLFVHLQHVAEKPDLIRTRITAGNKAEYRPILQWLGSYLVMKADPGIWYNELVREAQAAATQGTALCTIGGVRFPSDADIVRKAGGFVILIHRPLMSEPDLTDPTERERVGITPNITFVNDAGIDELIVTAERMYTDLKLGKAKTRYITSEIDRSSITYRS